MASPNPHRVADSDDSKAAVFPESLSIEPLNDHKQTFIVLHGRGSTASKFAPPFLSMPSSETGLTIQQTFPNARLIFPTASLTRSSIYKRSYTHQWFNSWHLEDYTKRQDMMIDGLQASVPYIHNLLKEEIETVGARNVFIFGLSQGCATSLCVFLTWEGGAFGGVVGMCGWLPFGNVVAEIAGGEEEEGENPFAAKEDDVFENSECEDECEKHDSRKKHSEKDPRKQAVAFLRETLELGLDAGEAFLDVPVFLGHGTEDEKVALQLGREARKCLDLVGVQVQMNEYENLGHWYSEDMLSDIFQFVKDKLETDIGKD